MLDSQAPTHKKSGRERPPVCGLRPRPCMFSGPVCQPPQKVGSCVVELKSPTGIRNKGRAVLAYVCWGVASSTP
eukprot:769632-Pyramimonas_sp.AAC.1